MNRADLLKSASLSCSALAFSEGATVVAADAAASTAADAELNKLLAEDRRDFYR